MTAVEMRPGLSLFPLLSAGKENASPEITGILALPKTRIIRKIENMTRIEGDLPDKRILNRPLPLDGLQKDSVSSRSMADDSLKETRDNLYSEEIDSNLPQENTQDLIDGKTYK